MNKARVVSNIEFQVGKIDERIYGSFLEHMGRVVYTGVYEPGHPCADENGFRKDVIEAVRELGITQIRYPGGNFVSCYHWEDGVGPKADRPQKLELAWKAIETNQFGTNEFMEWIKKTGASPMLAVNLGTRGIEDSVNYLEYCNFPGGTKYSDLRREHGVENPYHVKTWCLGNEMDGPWQIGHKTAEEYGRLAAETAKAMKVADSEIELVVCGSSLKTMDTFPEWEAAVLEHTYDYVDYISLHQYFDGQDKGTEAFLAQADEMNEYIKTVTSVCDYIKAKKRSDKQMNISFDEWGVWAYSSKETVAQCDHNSWQVAPHLSEMIYTFEDSLLFGGMLLALLKNADRVKMACQSLLTNISACIMTEENGEMWLQPTYYPFSQAAKYAHGVVLQSQNEKNASLDQVIVYNEEKKEVVIFAINRSTSELLETVFEVQGLHCKNVIEYSIMKSDDIKGTNREDHNNIVPGKSTSARAAGNQVIAEIPALSWNMIRIAVD